MAGGSDGGNKVLSKFGNAVSNAEEKKSEGDSADRFATSSRKAGPTIFEGHGVAVGVNSGGGSVIFRRDPNMVAVATGTFRLRVDTKGERREDPRVSMQVGAGYGINPLGCPRR